MRGIRIPNLEIIDPVFVSSERKTVTFTQIPHFDSRINAATREKISVKREADDALAVSF